MAERKSISPRIRADLWQQLQTAVKDQGCTQGDVIEAALEAYWQGDKDGGSLQLVMERLADLDQGLRELTTGVLTLGQGLSSNLMTLEEGVAGLTPLLEKIVDILAEQTKEALPPVADDDQLYKDDPLMQPGPEEGELVAETTPPLPPADPARPVGWWGRRFPKRGQA